MLVYWKYIVYRIKVCLKSYGLKYWNKVSNIFSSRFKNGLRRIIRISSYFYQKIIDWKRRALSKERFKILEQAGDPRKRRRKAEEALLSSVYFAEIIVHRLGDDYIVPKWRLADQVADIVRSPSGNSIREYALQRVFSLFHETYRVYRGEIILADECYFEYETVDKRGNIIFWSILSLLSIYRNFAIV